MATLYLDTSALGRLLLGERDASAIRAELPRFDQHVSSRLLALELRRLAMRKGLLENAGLLLSRVAMLPLDEALLTAAETVPPPTVATLDAIHLASALRLAADGRVDAVMTYDARLAAGARHHGLEVVAP